MPARLNYNNNGKYNRACLKMIYHSFSCGILALPFDGEIQSFGDISPYSCKRKMVSEVSSGESIEVYLNFR